MPRAGQGEGSTLRFVPRPPSDRPARIADASLEIIATSGLHALTHRTIDAKLGFPAGTTSYYARTRAELISRALNLLMERFAEAVQRLPQGSISTDEEAVRVISRMVLMLAEKPYDQIARFVLLIDLRDDPELHRLINASSGPYTIVSQLTVDLLERFDVPEPRAHAAVLLAMVDGLLLARLAGASDVELERAVAVFWAGLPRS